MLIRPPGCAGVRVPPGPGARFRSQTRQRDGVTIAKCELGNRFCTSLRYPFRNIRQTPSVCRQSAWQPFKSGVGHQTVIRARSFSDHPLHPAGNRVSGHHDARPPRPANAPGQRGRTHRRLSGALHRQPAVRDHRTPGRDAGHASRPAAGELASARSAITERRAPAAAGRTRTREHPPAGPARLIVRGRGIGGDCRVDASRPEPASACHSTRQGQSTRRVPRPTVGQQQTHLLVGRRVEGNLHGEVRLRTDDVDPLVRR